MILWIHAYASYLSVSHAHTRSGGSYYLSNNSDDPPNNGSINTICKTVGNVIVSATEAKIGSTYINAQDSVLVKTYLIKIGHPQPPTKIQIDNTTDKSFSKGTLKKKDQNL